MSVFLSASMSASAAVDFEEVVCKTDEYEKPIPETNGTFNPPPPYRFQPMERFCDSSASSLILSIEMFSSSENPSAVLSL